VCSSDLSNLIFCFVKSQNLFFQKLRSVFSKIAKFFVRDWFKVSTCIFLDFLSIFSIRNFLKFFALFYSNLNEFFIFGIRTFLCKNFSKFLSKISILKISFSSIKEEFF